MDRCTVSGIQCTALYSALYTGLASCWRFVRTLNFPQSLVPAGERRAKTETKQHKQDTGACYASHQ